jgi:hypothetical protein
MADFAHAIGWPATFGSNRGPNAKDDFVSFVGRHGKTVNSVAADSLAFNF